MLRTQVDLEDSDFNHIKIPSHIANVTEKIVSGFNQYWTRLFNSYKSPLDMSDLCSKFKITNAKPKDDSKVKSEFIKGRIVDYLNQYLKESEKYQSLFNNEIIQEFLDDDPALFKTSLSKECPVIRRSLQSRREEMKEWQKQFKITSSKELLGITSNLIDFSDEYIESLNPETYAAIDDHSMFGFDPLDDETTLRVPGVIGMGIKSVVLYHLSPSIFPRRSRFDLYGLFFMTDKDTFGLPSRTSEFLMINDTLPGITEWGRNYKMDQNYWYPYSLFSFHCMTVYRLLKTRLASIGVETNDFYRFVYVGYFLGFVCEQNREYIDTMLGGDEE